KAGSGSASPIVAAMRAMFSALVRARAASRARRAAASTNQLTTTATPRNTDNATTFSPVATVQWWNGGVKYQFASRNAATAVAIPGAVPPIAATATTSER